MGYTHVSQGEQYQIRCLHKGGWSQAVTGRKLQRAASAISRELQRDASSDGRYDTRYAQREAMRRRHTASVLPRLDAETSAAVEARLREDWSPKQTAATDEMPVSVERICQHIAADR